MLTNKVPLLMWTLLLPMLLLGCQTTRDDIGQGPIELSGGSTTRLHDFLDHDCPIVLVASPDGSRTTRAVGSSLYCGYYDEESWVKRALENCTKWSKSGACKVFALGRDIVWNGPISYRIWKWSPIQQNQNSVVLKSGRQGTEPDSRYVLPGLATFTDDGKRVSFSFPKTKRFGRCSGQATLPDGRDGTFEINCSKAGQLVGEIEIEGPGRKGNGGGQGLGSSWVDFFIIRRR
jgi:hypothetical protein